MTYKTNMDVLSSSEKETRTISTLEELKTNLNNINLEINSLNSNGENINTELDNILKEYYKIEEENHL